MIKNLALFFFEAFVPGKVSISIDSIDMTKHKLHLTVSVRLINEIKTVPILPTCSRSVLHWLDTEERYFNGGPEAELLQSRKTQSNAGRRCD